MIKKCTRIIKHIAAKYKMQQGVADFFFHKSFLQHLPYFLEILTPKKARTTENDLCFVHKLDNRPRNDLKDRFFSTPNHPFRTILNLNTTRFAKIRRKKERKKPRKNPKGKPLKTHLNPQAATEGNPTEPYNYGSIETPARKRIRRRGLTVVLGKGLGGGWARGRRGHEAFGSHGPDSGSEPGNPMPRASPPTG
jgi:hypothetical protein